MGKHEKADKTCNKKLTTQQGKTTAASPIQLWTVEQVADRLGIGIRTVWRLDKDEKLPAALRIGHRKRWNANDIELWLEWKCPDRKKFEQLIKTKERKVAHGENNA